MEETKNFSLKVTKLCLIWFHGKNFFFIKLDKMFIEFTEKKELFPQSFSVWQLEVQFSFKFFQSQNQFSLDWLNLQSNKKIFAHYILPRVQKIFCLFIGLDSSVKALFMVKAGSEWSTIFPQICMTKCQTLYVHSALWLKLIFTA